MNRHLPHKSSNRNRQAICYVMITLLIAFAGTAIGQGKPGDKKKASLSADHSMQSPSKIDIKEIVDKIQSYYTGTADYQASFAQTTSHKMFEGRLERAYGIVKFKKGGFMRWEYVKPEEKLFVYDGRTLWIYEPEVPQVFSGSADAERLKRALAFISGEGKLSDEYNVNILKSEKFGFPEGIVLGLTPKDKQSPYKRIELYVDSTSYRVVRSVVVDYEDNRNRLDFTNPILGSNLPAEDFAFSPPKGVPVIDPSKPQ